MVTRVRVHPQPAQIRRLLIVSVIFLFVIRNLLSFTTNNNDESEMQSTLEKKEIIRGTSRAVIHMGIYKTGTTTIQEKSKVYKKFLERDGYEMPWNVALKHMKGFSMGKFRLNQQAFATCFLPSWSGEAKEVPCNRNLLSAVSLIAKEKKNLFVSAEHLSNLQKDGLDHLSSILSNWDEVIYVVYHRRFYSFITSIYNQMYKWGNDFEERTTTTTIVDFIENAMSLPTLANASHYGYRYSYFLLDRMKDYFGDDKNIVLMDYHDRSRGGSDESFYCHVLPNANSTCNVIKRTSRQQRSNAAKSMDYEDLAFVANKRGLIKISNLETLKKTVAVKVMMYHKREFGLSDSTFPRICPTKNALDKLWDFSLMVEQKLFPEHFLDDGSYLAAMRLDFDTMANTTLCKLDFDSILAEERWITLFQNLNTTHPRKYVGNSPLEKRIRENNLKLKMKKTEPITGNNWKRKRNQMKVNPG